MSTSPAPITQPVLDDNGLPTLPWTLFFSQSFNGDAGDNWSPVITGLTGTTDSVIGRYYRLSQFLVYFAVTITPSGATTSTAGTTFIGDFPLNFTNDSFNTVVSGAGGGSVGINRASDNRIYFPAWTGVTIPLTIIGAGEAR